MPQMGSTAEPAGADSGRPRPWEPCWCGELVIHGEAPPSPSSVAADAGPLPPILQKQFKSRLHGTTQTGTVGSTRGD